MSYLKPQSPIKNSNDHIYPLTTYDQIIMPDGSRWDGAIAPTDNFIQKSGDEMTGALTTPGLVLKDVGGGSTTLAFSDGTGEVLSYLQSNTATGALTFGQQTAGAQFKELYRFPTADETLTEDTVYELLTTKNSVKSVNGENGEVTITPEKIGAVKTTGDTMTGALALQGAGIQFLSENAALLGRITVSSTSKNIRFHQIYSPDEPYEYYMFPAASQVSGDSNVSYSILTSKNPVTVAQGGTGATTATEALQALGAVSKTGDTMTGQLTIRNAGIIYQTADGVETIRFGSNTTDGSQLHIWQYNPTGTNYEYFKLPRATADVTTNTGYDILTSKDTVTIAQGGTGATTAAAARTALGVPTFTYDSGTLAITT